MCLLAVPQEGVLSVEAICVSAVSAEARGERSTHRSKVLSASSQMVYIYVVLSLGTLGLLVFRMHRATAVPLLRKSLLLVDLISSEFDRRLLGGRGREASDEVLSPRGELCFHA